MTTENEKKLRQTCYDLVTLLRVYPWLFLINDNRQPEALIKIAHQDAKSFVDAFVDKADGQGQQSAVDRYSLMRGMLYNMATASGISVNADSIEYIVKKIAESSDGEMLVQIDDDLKGEIA